MTGEDRGDKDDSQSKEESSNNQEAGIAIPPEILKDVPQAVQSQIKKFFAMSMGYRGVAPHPILTKITPGHIDKIIDNVEREDVRQSQADASTRKYYFWAFVFIVLVFVILVVFLVFQRATELLINLMVGMFSLAGGFGIGRFFPKER